MRLAVRGLPTGDLHTHFAKQAPPWGGLVTCRVLFARAPVLGLWFFVSVNLDILAYLMDQDNSYLTSKL